MAVDGVATVLTVLKTVALSAAVALILVVLVVLLLAAAFRTARLKQVNSLRNICLCMRAWRF
jgi:hypothetical protein